jgi:hypothetical protein
MAKLRGRFAETTAVTIADDAFKLSDKWARSAFSGRAGTLPDTAMLPPGRTPPR